MNKAVVTFSVKKNGKEFPVSRSKYLFATQLARIAIIENGEPEEGLYIEGTDGNVYPNSF